MKYTVSIERALAGTREVPRNAKLVLHAAPSEVAWHIALKLLGYLLFMEYAPRIEEGIGWHYKPDLVSLNDQGALRLWVDCGNIAVRKIERVAQKVGPDVPFIILRRTARDAQLLAQSLGRMRYPGRVRLLAFENGMVDALAAHLDTTNHIRATLSAHAEQGRTTGSDGTEAIPPEALASITLDIANRKGHGAFTSTITQLQPGDSG